MDKRHHKTLMLVVIVLIVLILLLRFARGGSFMSNSRAANLPTIGTDNYTLDGGTFSYASGAINIPGLIINGARDYHIIGSCSSDCMSRKSRFVDPFGTQSGPTYVFNQANKGAINYNYTTEVAAPVVDWVSHTGPRPLIFGTWG